jgi:sec-independent protein translocase protein TatA
MHFFDQHNILPYFYDMVGTVLFMNDVGGTEVLVIVLVALMFFGSKSIPGIAKTMGSTMRQIRDAQNGIQDEIRKGGEAMRKDLNLENIIQETEETVSQPFEKATRDLNTGLTFEPPRIPNTPEIPNDEIKVVGKPEN